MTATQSDQLTASDVAHDRVEVDASVFPREGGARAAGRRLAFVPSEPARYAIWLLYIGAFLSDMLVTMSGQSDAWWRGVWLATNERNPAIEHLLQNGPGVMVIFCGLCVALAYLLARNIPEYLGLALALWFAYGHAFAASNWFTVYSNPLASTAVLVFVGVLAAAACVATMTRGRVRRAQALVAVTAFLALGATVAIGCLVRFDRSSFNEPDVVSGRLIRAGALAEADRVATEALDDRRLGPTARFNAHMAVARVAAIRCDRDRLVLHLDAAMATGDANDEGRALLLGFANEEGARLLLSVGDTNRARESFSRAAEAFEAFAAMSGVENASDWRSRASDARRRAAELECENERGAVN